MKIYLKVVPVKENGDYKFFVDRYHIDESDYRESKSFVALPLEFPDEEKKYYEKDGPPTFSLSKSGAQELVNELCNRLGFKPE